MSLFPAYSSGTSKSTKYGKGDKSEENPWHTSFTSFPKEKVEEATRIESRSTDESDQEVALVNQFEGHADEEDLETKRTKGNETREEGECTPRREKRKKRKRERSKREYEEKKRRSVESEEENVEEEYILRKETKNGDSDKTGYRETSREGRLQAERYHSEQRSVWSRNEIRNERDRREQGNRHQEPSKESHKKRKRKKRREEEFRRERKKKEKESKLIKKSKEESNLLDISDGQVFARFNQKLVFSDGTNLPPEEAFRLDVKGDRSNLTFDRTPAKDMARFWSVTRYALGFDFESNRKQHKRSDRYFDSNKLVNPEDVERIVPAKNAGTGDLPAFIDGTEAEDTTERKVVGIYDLATSAYIAGAAAPVTRVSEAAVDEEETIIRQQVKDYNRMLSKNPKDLDLWLKFVDFQDKAVAFENEGKRRKPNTTYLAEKKISILDKAILELPNKMELVVERLHVGKTVWTNEELRLRWLDALKLHPANVQLWNAYFEFMEHFTEFKVGDVLGGYRRCMKKLTSVMATVEGKRRRDLEMDLKGILFRLCLYLKNVGYTEKAVGLYQMQLELAVRTSREVKSSCRFPVLLEMADKFWDSHVPRIGEEGSQVWTSVLTNPSSRHRRNIQGLVREEEILMSGVKKEEIWIQLESLREKTQWQPWTPTEEVDEVEDKDRSVALEDLKPYLFEVSHQSTAVSLLTDFLRFLGCFDSECNKPAIYSSFNLGLLCKTTMPEAFHTPSYSFEESLLCEGWQSPIVHFVHNLISQCFPCFEIPEQVTLLTFWLRFETLKLTYMSEQRRLTYWKYLKKKIKPFMAGERIRENVLVYTKFIEMCDAAGESEEALKFFSTLFMCQDKSLFDLDCTKKVHFIEALLSNTKLVLTKYQLNLARKEEVLSALVQALCEEKYSSNRLPGQASLLRAKNRVMTLVSELSDEGDELRLYTLWCCCCLYLTFFIDGFGEVVKLFREFTGEMEGRTAELEDLRSTVLILGVAAVQLKQPGSFSLLADLLSTLVQTNPTSLSVISAFVEYQRISNGSKRLLTQAMKVAEDAKENELLVFGLALSHMEIHKNIEDGEEELWKEIGTPCPVKVAGLKYRIKHFFSSSMEFPTSRKSVLLWRIYLKFLHTFGFTDELRSVPYQAMRECPFSKDILLDAVKFIPDSIEAIYRLMSDKDMRVRIPLEELDLLIEDQEEINE